MSLPTNDRLDHVTETKQGSAGGRTGVLRTKDVNTVIHQNDEPGEGGDSGHLAKRLKARDLMGFGIGIVIGTGIFVLTGLEARSHAGPAITISFVIAGIVAMLAALCYAELAAAVPTAAIVPSTSAMMTAPTLTTEFSSPKNASGRLKRSWR